MPSFALTSPLAPATVAGYDRRLTAVLVVGFCAFLNVYAPQPLLPLLAHAFHASRAVTSLTVSMTTLSIALFSPLAGSWVGKCSRHGLLRPSLAVLLVSTLLAPLSPSLPVLMLCRFVTGAALPILLAVTMALVGEEWSGRGVGRVMSLYVSGTVLGGFSGRFLSGLVAQHWGWSAALGVVALLNVLGAWAVLHTMPDSAPHAKRLSGFSFAVARRLLGQPALQATCAVGFNVLFGLTATFTYVTYYLAAPPFNLGPAALGSVFFVYLIGGLVTPLAGRVLDRIGFGFGLRLSAAVVVLGGLITLVPTLPVVVAGLAFVCTGAFISQSAATGFITETAGDDRGTAIGIYLFCYYLGGTLGAALPGLFWSLAGWPACVLCVLAAQTTILIYARRMVPAALQA